MSQTTLGVKLKIKDIERLKVAAASLDRTPHWLIKQAALNWLSRVESGDAIADLIGSDHVDSDAKKHSVRNRNQE